MEGERMLEQLEHAVNEMLAQHFPNEKVHTKVDDRAIATLYGECSSWDALIDIGHAAARYPGIRNAVSEMTVKGLVIPQRDYAPYVQKGRSIGVIDEVDVVIVGAGIVGCAIARELCKYNLKIVVVEKEDDVAAGASKANNGCIHHGMDCKPGTLKAELNVKGNRRYSDWERELNIGLKRLGYLEVITDLDDLPLLVKRFHAGLLNGVDGITMVDGARAKEIEPGLVEQNIDAKAALHMPSHGFVETPYVCVALGENAVENGVKFMFNTIACAVDLSGDKIDALVTNKGIIKTKFLINAAGVYADDIAKMAKDWIYTIHNRKGTIAIFDKATPPAFRGGVAIATGLVKAGKLAESKGGGMHPTPENNLLCGPSAKEVPDREDTETTQDGLDYVMSGCHQDPNSTKADIIKIFCGARPADFKEDFVIEPSEVTKGFIHAACTQSPAVASAPAIADRVVGFVVDAIRAEGGDIHIREDYNPYRAKPVEFRHMTREEQAKLIEKDPRYGRIICRCEQVTEGEIIDALRSPLRPGSINAIKFRTRAGMGRCQGGFCQPRVLEIIAKELGLDPTEVTLDGEGSNILLQVGRPDAKDEGRC
jgi:glycerol-3-phosphate dehydrogenase